MGREGGGGRGICTFILPCLVGHIYNIYILQCIPPIEQDIAKEKNRIPRNEKKMQKTEVSITMYSVSLSGITIYLL